MITDFDAIIFDLGGVILNIDYYKTSQAFKKLGITNFDSLYSQAKQNHIFDDLETGKISADGFRNYIKSNVDVSITDSEITDAWNAMLLDLPKNRVELLIKLSQTYPIFLYSNTNIIHLKAFKKIIKNTYGDANLLENLFNNTYYSHELGERKPNTEGFLQILNENSLIANRTLFIDDSKQHIEGANAIGLKTYHLINKDIVELFNEIVK